MANNNSDKEKKTLSVKKDSIEEAKTESKELTEQQKKTLNKKANSLLDKLADILNAGNFNQLNKQELKKVLSDLDSIGKKLESSLIDDIVFIVKATLNSIIKEKKNGKK